MIKYYSILVKIVFTIIIIVTVFLLNSMHYKNQAHDRINQVIAYQGANLSNARLVYDEYDYFHSEYRMEVYYNDDPGILYKYRFDRSLQRVYVFASLGNASLDLTDRKGKYRYFFHTYFDYNGNIKKH